MRVFGIGLALVVGCVAVGFGLSASHDVTRTGPRLKAILQDSAAAPTAEPALIRQARDKASDTTPASLAELTRRLRVREANMADPAEAMPEARALPFAAVSSASPQIQVPSDEGLAQQPHGRATPWPDLPQVEPVAAAFGLFIPEPESSPDIAFPAPEYDTDTPYQAPARLPSTRVSPARASGAIPGSELPSSRSEKIRSDNYLIGVFR